MTTLEAIGFSLAGGGIVFSTAMCLFGCAVRSRSIYIAPRCTARPKETIYNPNPSHPSQNRGSPIFGWIPWALGLTYPQMLEGVPGTGTRKKGMEGSLLKVNLDGVVLLRFHEMCLRVSLLGTILCLVVILPLNLSAQCYNVDDEDANVTSLCLDTTVYNKTDFEKTTLANIPQLSNSQFERIWGGGYGGLLGRLYTIVFCSWIITFYVFYTARKEWLDIHAMRRVYYLESDVWGERKRELQKTPLLDPHDNDGDDDYFDQEDDNDLDIDSKSGANDNCTDHDDDDSILENRDPWIPHPEQRDTVPNIALYSILVGSLPSLPNQFCEGEDVEKAVVFSKRQSIDWQLEVTKTFFDQCVPNQPGFSSSVAAVTILPGASKLSRAWSKWYSYAAALRRLRFVRRLASQMRHYDIDSINGNSISHSERERDRYINKEIAKEIGSRKTFDPEPDLPPNEQHADYFIKQAEQQRMEQEQQRYYREVFSTYQDEAEDLFLNPELGPEQAAVYSRELAQSAAQCCPNGCCEDRVMRARIDELNVREQEAVSQVQEAYADLLQARDEAAATDGSGAQDLFADEPASPNKLNLPASLTEEAEIMEKSKKKEQQEFSIFNLEVNTGAATDNAQSSLTLMTASRKREGPGESMSGNLRGSPQSCIGFVDMSAAGMRKRAHTKSSHNSSNNFSEDWEKVEQIVNEGQWAGSVRLEGRHAKSGGYKRPRLYWKDLQVKAEEQKELVRNWWNSSKEQTLDDLARESTYAIVTFTSRQAAIAARKCLLDGRGQSRWLAESQVPVPPLADASPCKLCPCRGWCRPVTLTIPDKQKIFRNLFSKAILATIYIFYTLPLTFAVSLANPSEYDEVFPFIKEFQLKHAKYYDLISGLIPALIWTVFFSICPIMFKMIANFGSNASSVMMAGMFLERNTHYDENLPSLLRNIESNFYCFCYLIRIQGSAVLLVVHGTYCIFGEPSFNDGNQWLQ